MLKRNMTQLTNAYRTNIQVRYSDTDALGHINNAVYATYAEFARIDFFRNVNLPERSLILAHLSLDFRAQVRFGDSVYVLTSVAKLGNSSIHLSHQLYANESLAAEMKAVVVHFDYEAQSPKPLPDTMRQQLSSTLGD